MGFIFRFALKDGIRIFSQLYLFKLFTITIIVDSLKSRVTRKSAINAVDRYCDG